MKQKLRLLRTVLAEGRLGFLIPRVMDPVEAYGEMGAAAALAHADGLPLYTWEPSPEWEVTRMLDSFPAQRVALFYVLRPYFGQLRFGRPADPDGFVEEFRRKRTRYPGLEGTLPSIAAMCGDRGGGSGGARRPRRETTALTLPYRLDSTLTSGASTTFIFPQPPLEEPRCPACLPPWPCAPSCHSPPTRRIPVSPCARSTGSTAGASRSTCSAMS